MPAEPAESTGLKAIVAVELSFDCFFDLRDLRFYFEKSKIIALWLEKNK